MNFALEIQKYKANFLTSNPLIAASFNGQAGVI